MSAIAELNKLIDLNLDISEKLDKGAEVSIITADTIRYRPTSEFVFLFAESLFRAIDEYDLNATDIKVILRIIGYAQYGNLIMMSRKSLAKDVGIDNSRLGKILKKLHASGVLLTEDEHMYLNPQVIAKGKLRKFADGQEYENIIERGAEVLQEKLSISPNIETKKMKERRFVAERIQREQRQKMVQSQLMDNLIKRKEAD